MRCCCGIASSWLLRGCGFSTAAAGLKLSVRGNRKRGIDPVVFSLLSSTHPLSCRFTRFQSELPAVSSINPGVSKSAGRRRGNGGGSACCGVRYCEGWVGGWDEEKRAMTNVVARFCDALDGDGPPTDWVPPCVRSSPIPP